MILILKVCNFYYKNNIVFIKDRNYAHKKRKTQKGWEMYIIVEKDFNNRISFLTGYNAFIIPYSDKYKLSGFKTKKDAEHRRMILEVYENRFRLEIINTNILNLPKNSIKLLKKWYINPKIYKK